VAAVQAADRAAQEGGTPVEVLMGRAGAAVARAAVAAHATHVLRVPAASQLLAPLVYLIPLQLLSYHVAVARGCPIDKPRNLAKSVTVE
jgi:glucosamine 6-phosphate synthetase-like amidotransferase/phosphosugar isomerase protein